MKDRLSFKDIFSVAILGTIVLTCTNGMTFSGITAFDKAILDDFGWTKSELKFRAFINLFIAGAIMPFVGVFIDKYGAKRTIMAGLLMISVLYFSYGFIQDKWHLYAIHLGFAFAVAGAGGLAVIIMVSQRIKERRGTAIGIALAGTSAGGIIITQIATRLLEQYGWRASFKIEAVIPLVIMVIIFFFIKPVDKAAENDASKEENSGDSSFKAALMSPVFWALCFAGVFCFYGIMGIISNLFLYLTELGYSTADAGNVFSIFFFIILVAKFSSGLVSEYINEYKLFKIQLIIMTIGTVGMAMNTIELVWPSLIAVGLGWGGLYTLFNYIIIQTFGIKAAGKIGGVISTFESIGAGLGAWLTGLISDKTGSYSASFWLVVALLLMSLVISFFIKPVKAEQVEVSY